MRWLLAFLALLMTAPASASPVRVDVTRTRDAFIATYRFPKAAPAWGFFRSAVTGRDKTPWRPASWRVLTPGVRIERHGQYDVLTAGGKPVPRTVRIAVTPFTGYLVADYVPAMRLGTGWAIFDGHYSVFAAPSVKAVAALPVDLNGNNVDDPGTLVRFAGLTDRQIAGDLAGYRAGGSEGAFGLFGVPVASSRNGVATVVDPALPAWLGQDVADWAPKLLGAYTERLGPRAIPQATIMMGWDGAEHGGASMNGGALKGLIMMRFSGRDLLQPLPDYLPRMRWFIAHETGHFWLGQTVMVDRLADSWITEGGADMLAVRILGAIDPAFDHRPFLNKELADCASFASKPVGGAGERGEQRAFYACGAVFGLVAETYAGGDFFSFYRALKDKAGADRTIDGAEWLDVLSAKGAPTSVVAQIRQLIDKGAPDGKAAIARLLTDAGIAHTISAEGVPQV